MAEAGDSASAEFKGLAALYSVLCYAMRELASLEVACPAAEEAVAIAQAAIRVRLSAVGTSAGDADAGDQEMLVH